LSNRSNLRHIKNNYSIDSTQRTNEADYKKIKGTDPKKSVSQLKSSPQRHHLLGEQAGTAGAGKKEETNSVAEEKKETERKKRIYFSTDNRERERDAN